MITNIEGDNVCEMITVALDGESVFHIWWLLGIN